MTKPRFPTHIAALPTTVPFVGPETLERQSRQVFAARLGANENGFGPSPHAIEVFKEAAGEIWKYGDPESHDLRQELAAYHGVPMENIVVGEGIDGLLGYLARLLIGPGDVAVTSSGAYPTFNYHITGNGGRLEMVPYRDDHENLPALIEKARDVDAKLIYFANPDNPMGTWFKGADIAAQLDDIPDGCLLVLDEAYVELAPKGTAAEYAVEHPKVIRMRTFSKGYGLAGARVGYAMGAADLIQSFNKIRNHFGMNRASQAAALAALRDQEWLAHIRTEVASSRQRISDIAQKHGLRTLPSATNFVAIDTGRDAEFAATLVSQLAEHRVFIRMPFAPPQNRCIRVSCGPEPELQLFEQALRTILT